MEENLDLTSNTIVTPKEPIYYRLLRAFGLHIEEPFLEARDIEAYIKEGDGKFELVGLYQAGMFAYIKDMYGFRKYEFPVRLRSGEQYKVVIKNKPGVTIKKEEEANELGIEQ